MNLKDRTFKEYFLFIFGLFIAAIGVAITKKSDLGVSPVSSIPNVMSLYYPWLTLGNGLIIWNCVLIALQVIILRRNFKLFQLLQVPLSFAFGYFTDFGTFMISFYNSDAYLFRIMCVIVGTIVLGLGIAIMVSINIIMNSGEAFVKAVSDTIHVEFGTVKVIFDISSVSIAIILSLLLFEGRIVGTREGTLIAALFTGVCVKFFMKRLNLKK